MVRENGLTVVPLVEMDCVHVLTLFVSIFSNEASLSHALSWVYLEANLHVRALLLGTIFQHFFPKIPEILEVALSVVAVDEPRIRI